MTREQLAEKFQEMIDLREKLYDLGESIREEIGLDEDATIIDQIRDGEITNANYAVKICENGYDIRLFAGDDEWQTKWEALKRELFTGGMGAINDFIGYECPYHDTYIIDNILDDIADQMPDEEMNLFFEKYLPTAEEEQERI